MRRMRAVFLSLFACAALCACTSRATESLFDKSPAGVETKIVMLELVDTDKGTLTVGSNPLNELERRTDVYGWRRAPYRNQFYVLVNSTADPEALADSFGRDYRVRVVRVFKRDADETTSE